MPLATTTPNPTALTNTAQYDFDGDGTSDVVLQNSSIIVDWIIQNGQYTTANVVITVGYNVLGAGDFDGNGTTDLLLQNGATIVACIMQNGQVSTTNVLTTAADGWTVVGSGDFNADGTSDVLVQSGGTVAAWTMQAVPLWLRRPRGAELHRLILRGCPAPFQPLSSPAPRSTRRSSHTRTLRQDGSKSPFPALRWTIPAATPGPVFSRPRRSTGKTRIVTACCLNSTCVSCSKLACTSATRPTAGTRRCRTSSSARATTSTSSI